MSDTSCKVWSNMGARSGQRRQLQRKVAELASTQHGLIARRQAVGLGMSEAAISRRLSAGDWVRVLPGVYRFAAAPQTAAQALAAAGLWAGPDAAISHRTALGV